MSVAGLAARQRAQLGQPVVRVAVAEQLDAYAGRTGSPGFFLALADRASTVAGAPMDDLRKNAEAATAATR